MRRLAVYAAGLFALGLLFGSILEAQVPGLTATPGSVVVRGEWISAETGCLAFLNSERMLKQTGRCNFGVVVPGVKLNNFLCQSHVSDEAAVPGVRDTIIDCTYTKAVLNANYNPQPHLQAGDMMLFTSSYAQTTGKCLSDLNISVLRCGFNVVLVGVAIPQLGLTMDRKGGNSWLHGWYAPVKP